MLNLKIEDWARFFRDIFDFLKASVFGKSSNGPGVTKGDIFQTWPGDVLKV